MEPENGPLEDYFPLQPSGFRVLIMLIFPGVVMFKTQQPLTECGWFEGVCYPTAHGFDRSQLDRSLTPTLSLPLRPANELATSVGAVVSLGGSRKNSDLEATSVLAK